MSVVSRGEVGCDEEEVVYDLKLMEPPLVRGGETRDERECWLTETRECECRVRQGMGVLAPSRCTITWLSPGELGHGFFDLGHNSLRSRECDLGQRSRRMT